MKRATTTTVLAVPCVLVCAPFAFASGGLSVVPSTYDPAGTHMAAAEWERGIGCPFNASISLDGSTLTPYQDPACTSGDLSDTHVEGLLLSKNGPIADYVAAQAAILGVVGQPVNELGYDIRKPGAPFPRDPRGSHCDDGSPRFNVVIGGFTYFVGCSSPAPDMDTPTVGGKAWQRLRWGTPTDLAAAPQCVANSCAPNPDNPCTISLVHPGYCNIKGQTVDSIDILFDDGDDTGPNYFALAVLDNIDFNGALVGKGPDENRNKDEDEARGEDGNGDSFYSDDSPSRPESSSLSYEDRSQSMKMQSVNGARSITYSGPCVSYAGDGVMNGKAGYLFTFEACSLSVLGTGIGNFAIAVTGPAGFLYQKSAILTSGSVSIHPH